MEITVKTLQQKVFKIQAELNDTVSDLKNKIKDDQGFDVNSQKLIFSGKILNDDRTVESLQIKPKDFLVVMVSKPKPQAPATSTTPTTPQQQSTKSESEQQPQQPQQPQQSTEQSQPSLSASTEQSNSDGNSLVMGSQLEIAVNNMVEMGFDKPQVMKAMRASFNNPERAVEYLMTGIPEHLNQPEPQSQPQSQSQSNQDNQQNAPLNLFDAARQQSETGTNPSNEGLPSLGGAGGDDQTGQLADLIQAAQQNPALLQPLIQNIAQSNPALAQVLATNPQAVVDLLSGEGGEFDDEEGGSQVIHLTEEQAEAVGRLQALGFSRELCAQALLACEGNEELAANYLFEQQEDF